MCLCRSIRGETEEGLSVGFGRLSSVVSRGVISCTTFRYETPWLEGESGGWEGRVRSGSGSEPLLSTEDLSSSVRLPCGGCKGKGGEDVSVGRRKVGKTLQRSRSDVLDGRPGPGARGNPRLTPPPYSRIVNVGVRDGGLLVGKVRNRAGGFRTPPARGREGPLQTFVSTRSRALGDLHSGVLDVVSPRPRPSPVVARPQGSRCRGHSRGSWRRTPPAGAGNSAWTSRGGVCDFRGPLVALCLRGCGRSFLCGREGRQVPFPLQRLNLPQASGLDAAQRKVPRGPN